MKQVPQIQFPLPLFHELYYNHTSHENHIHSVTALPAAVGEQLRPTAPEQAGLRGGSGATLDLHLASSGGRD